MPRSSSSYLFPDLNVWLALSYERHVHHSPAVQWFETLPQTARLAFCRFTQIGLLRLLTIAAVMGGDGALSQREAWDVYDRWIQDDRIAYLEEPSTLEQYLQTFSQKAEPAPKDWADSYLAAFAEAAGIRLVTFDRALRQRHASTILIS